MADLNNGADTGSLPSSTKSPGGPIIQQSQESEEYQRALQTVVGTALGVILLVGLLALFFLLYRLRRQRRRSRFINGSQQQSPILQRSISLDVGSKPVPSVLVLYAYDCAMHEAVVVALSGLLMEVCGVTVSLDVLEENVIMERGLEDWLEDRLQEADFIVVVCSLGARLRCSKKRVRFREEAGHILPDYFAVAVDYVAEKLRVERSKGLGVGKFVTAVMDYSRLSDVPPQLEAATAFSLMRDLPALCAHLTCGTSSPGSQRKPLELEEGGGEGGEEGGLGGWQGTEAGQELWAALGQARHYFQAHPNWLEDRLQPLPNTSSRGGGGGTFRSGKPRRRRHRDRDAHRVPLLPPGGGGGGGSSSTKTAVVGGGGEEVSSSHSMGDVNSSANLVMIHMQTLPPRHRSRQNSLPSSLGHPHPRPVPNSNPGGQSLESHHSGHQPCCQQQSVSRSVDSFPPSSCLQPPLGGDDGFDGYGSWCLLCQQQREGWTMGVGGKRVRCSLHPQDSGGGGGGGGGRGGGVVGLSDTDGDSELEMGVEAVGVDKRGGGGGGCPRSKSLPSVERPPLTSSSPHLPSLPTSHTAVEGFGHPQHGGSNAGLRGSRTVLQAEVHKEWGRGEVADAAASAARDSLTHTTTSTSSHHHYAHTTASDSQPQQNSATQFELQPRLPPPTTTPTPTTTVTTPGPPPPKAWDLSQVPEAPKHWDGVMRPCGPPSPSSLSSSSSVSSSSSSSHHSGTDSLERDLRSITMPRIFDHSSTESGSYRPPLYGLSATAPRSLSSSALLTPQGQGRLPPGPCLTPSAHPAVTTAADFNFDFSPIRWGGDADLFEGTLDRGGETGDRQRWES